MIPEPSQDDSTAGGEPAGRLDDVRIDDDLDDETRTVRLRRRGAQPPSADADDPGHEGLDADDGSTVVVRRESKRRAEAAAAAADEPDPVTVLSRSRLRRYAPAALDTAPPDPREEAPLSYPPRAADPVIVPRAPAVPREPQVPVDTAAIDVSSRRRARRRLVGAVVAASVVAIAAITGIVLLLSAL